MKSRIFACFLCLATGFWGQSAAKPERPVVIFSHAPSQNQNDMEFIEGSSAETIKGEPYTAKETKEVTSVLADGNRVVKQTLFFVARDSNGRTFKAELHEGKPLSDAKWKLITDPATQATYMFMPDRTASTKHVAAQFKNSRSGREFVMADDLQYRSLDAPGELKRESLGTQIMEGVAVQGTRETRTVPAGTFGNEQAFDIASEAWYSADLHLAVLRKIRDPRVGETVWRLSDLKRSEPDPSLFQIPAQDQQKFDELANQASQPK